MKPVNLKLPNYFRRIFYLAVTTSLVSGLSFFYLNSWVLVEGDFGPEKHPWQFNVLRVHGMSAFFMLALGGSIVSNHAVIAWKTLRSRRLGILLLVMLGTMVVSGYSLYYMSSDVLRPWVAYLHLGTGTTFGVVLVNHIVRGRRGAEGVNNG